MKNIILLFTIILLSSCSSTKMIDSWTSTEYANYQPKKVLIVGVTENLTARKIFEEQLKNEFTKRGIQAIQSFDVFEPDFTNEKQTEEAINKQIEKTLNQGFDAILISGVKGVDEKVSYSGDSFRTNYYWRRFGRYYYLYQDVYFDKGYYNKYKIYHIESSLYNLNEKNDKSLVWVASYDIVDPKKISTTVNNYVAAIINSLEEKQIIPQQ